MYEVQQNKSAETPSDALGWSDELCATSSSGVLLAEGPGKFTVRKMIRGHFEGSEKMGPCPVAELELEVSDSEGITATVQEKLFLSKKMLFKIVAFARATELIASNLKDGDTFHMPWSEVVGSSGRCIIGHREWVGDDGEKRRYNTVKKYVV